MQEHDEDRNKKRVSNIILAKEESNEHWLVRLNNNIGKFALSPYSATAGNLYSYFYKKNNSNSKSKTYTKASLLTLSPVLLPATAVTTSLSLAAYAIEVGGVVVFAAAWGTTMPFLGCAAMINSGVNEILEKAAEKSCHISPNP